MAVAKNLRGTDRANPVPEFTGVGRRKRGELDGNFGTADVRGSLLTRVITLANFGGVDSFKVKVVIGTRDRIDITDQEEGRAGAAQTTAAFVRGTNCAASDLQAALRTATGDTALTVAGNTDAGPFTVTFAATPHRQALDFQLITLLGCSGHITSAATAYVTSNGLPGDVHKHGTDTGRPAAVATIGRGVGSEVFLGQSITTDGPGQTARATLVAPAVTTAAGGAGQVTLAATEDASGGTAANVGYALFTTVDDASAPVVYTEDDDGTVVITGLLAATDYYVRAFTQTQTGTSGGPNEASRVSRSAPAEYFTTT